LEESRLDSFSLKDIVLYCALYAVSDEAHQLLVSGRGGQLSDALLDSVGVAVGIGLYRIISRTKP